MIWTAVVDVPDPNKAETWLFQVMPSWKGLKNEGETSAETLSKFKLMAKDYAEPWNLLLNGF
jgi:hypothetical protein